MTIAYEASEMSGWLGLMRLFLRYRGTILHDTLTGLFFWIPNCLHVGLLVLGGHLRLPTEWVGEWEAYAVPRLPSSTALLGLPLLVRVRRIEPRASASCDHAVAAWVLLLRG
jgi:hypothetical protein